MTIRGRYRWNDKTQCVEKLPEASEEEERRICEDAQRHLAAITQADVDHILVSHVPRWILDNSYLEDDCLHVIH